MTRTITVMQEPANMLVDVNYLVERRKLASIVSQFPGGLCQGTVSSSSPAVSFASCMTGFLGLMMARVAGV
jgi:hypothetical protein